MKKIRIGASDVSISGYTRLVGESHHNARGTRQRDRESELFHYCSVYSLHCCETFGQRCVLFVAAETYCLSHFKPLQIRSEAREE